MKTRLLVLLATLAFLALGTVLAPAAHAGTQATCWTDPEEAAIGTPVTVYCAGFSRDTILNAYYVEPDGAAVIWGNFKTDENGSVAVVFNTKFGTFAAVSVGTWTAVFDEKGLANSIIAHAEVKFRVTGGTEGVSGATVWADPSQIRKDQGYTIYGSGFAPNEVVTIWWEYPNGDCSSFTDHVFVNLPDFRGYSAFIVTDVKADASGYFADFGGFNTTACEGTYRFVARGNTSGRGGETWLTLTGLPVETNASLIASKSLVAALFDVVYFAGSGYGSNEPISCWLRTPHGQVTEVDQLWQAPVKSDGAGGFSFPIYTGSILPGFPVASEGALGVYAMTCRGNLSGATGIAEFTVTGGMFDP